MTRPFVAIRLSATGILLAKTLLSPVIGLIIGMTILSLASSALANSGSIIVQSTTSTQNAGFYDHVLPQFTEQTGIKVGVVAVGTGQALKNASRCDGDLLIVHAREAEDAFISAGYGAKRHNLMYNDFVLVGPQTDPADAAHAMSVIDAMRRIHRTESPFASRGDESGTHKKERALWAEAGVNPVASGENGDVDWYLETGSGMGATLNFAVQSNSYALTDRATWLAFSNKFRHRILHSGDRRLFNQYGIVEISQDHCPAAAHVPAKTFTDWLLSREGQARIATLTRKGQQLFIPNAHQRD